MDDAIPIHIIPGLHTGKETYPAERPGRDISVYVHFPFCMCKCSFCPIKTLPYNRETAVGYVSALLKEIARNKKTLGDYSVNGIHFGGGTPSLLSVRDIDRILCALQKYTDIDKAEVVFEAHPNHMPDDLLDYLSQLTDCAVNFGVQSFDSAILSAVNRFCSAEKMLRVIEAAKRNVTAVGIDIICGWPASGPRTLENDLRCIKKIRPDHLSQYPLIERENAIPRRAHPRMPPNHADKAALNKAFEDMLSGAGYKRYSIFHYGIKGNASHRYGRSQLTGGRWLGLGAQAYTYMGHTAYKNPDVPEYIKGGLAAGKTFLNYTDRFLWEFAYLIRCCPLPAPHILSRYGPLVMPYVDAVTDELIKKRFMYAKTRLALTWKGVIHLNQVERIIMETAQKSMYTEYPLKNAT